jgi:Domain of unknown function (DUF4517)
LGFLQVKHRYRIELNIPIEILAKYCHDNHPLMLKEQHGENSVPNIHCKLLSFKSNSSKETSQSQFYEAEFEFFAHKEKLLKEELQLLTDDEKTVKLVFHARVLGRGKGTPMLKTGIHLLGIEDDDESGEEENFFMIFPFEKLFPNNNNSFFFFYRIQTLLTGRDSRERSLINYCTLSN